MDLTDLVKISMEHPSKEDLQKYLKEHPNADPSNHTVVDGKGDSSKGESEPSGQSKIKRLMSALGDKGKKVKQFATDSGYRQKVMGELKKKKDDFVQFAKAQKKQTSEMLGTVKDILKAPPKPSADAVSKAKKQAVNLLKMAFIGINEAVPIPGTLQVTFIATAAVNKVFKSNFSWFPETWAKVGRTAADDDAVLKALFDQLVAALKDPKVLEEAIDMMIDDAEKGGKTASSFLPGRDEIGDDVYWGGTGVIDYVLQGRSFEGTENSALQALTDTARQANALPLPVEAGTRVRFAYNLGSVLHYAHVPDEGVEGTVITVRASDGDKTVHNGQVMVTWDDGQFLPVQPDHLRLAKNKKQANVVRASFSRRADMAQLFTQAKTGATDLVHKATRDLWSFRKDGDEYVIERLFDGDGAPLKV